MQTASAFSSVQQALSFFVSTYRTLAEWRAVIARLEGFEAAIAGASAQPASTDSIEIATSTGSADIKMDQLLVKLPNGTPLVAAEAGLEARARTHHKIPPDDVIVG